jgi:glycerol-3-phosphate O-acyltransferase
MSDGPYRTLNMRQQWKQLLKRAYQHAFDSQDVIEAVCPALAGLRESVLHAQAIKRQAHQLARSRGISPEEAEANLDRLLSKHEAEWRSFVHSLGNKSFIRNWVASAA